MFSLKDEETPVKYLNNNYTEEELRHLNNFKSQLITSSEELSNYIYNARNNPDSVNLKAIIGRISDSTAMNLQNKKGKNKSLPTAHDSNNPVIARPKRSGVSSSSNNNIQEVCGNMQEK